MDGIAERTSARLFEQRSLFRSSIVSLPGVVFAAAMLLTSPLFLKAQTQDPASDSHGGVAVTYPNLPDAPQADAGSNAGDWSSSRSSVEDQDPALAGAQQNQQDQQAEPQPNAPAHKPAPGDPGDRIHYNTNGGPPPRYGQQPKRILGVMPNYRAVSVGAVVPPPTVKEKFWIATQNSFDYSAFIFNAIDVEIPYVERSYPQLGNGMLGYGRYYWRGFLDKSIGNYMTDAIVPTLTFQDSRYYTMGRGKWYKRLLYSYSRVLITPSDSGRNTFNFSEIVGKGAAAGLGDLYYPQSNGGATWTKTGQRWLVQVAVRDGGFDVFREFWPDISTHVLHMHPKNPTP